MSSALPIRPEDQPPQQGAYTKQPTGLRQSFSRGPMYPISPPSSSTGYAISIQRTSPDHDPHFTSTGSYIGPGLGMGNGSPMSLGMSFGANGDLLRSWKGMSYRQGNGGFGSFRNGMGSYIGNRIPKDDSNDPFLNGDTMSGSPMSFSSMRGLNSYRSPNALRPIPLSSSNRAFSNWTKEQFGVDKKEAEFMKDFSCCGTVHHSLHELLEHYEEEHVNSGKGGEGDGGFPVVADFDVEMDMFDGAEQHPSSSTGSNSTNSTQTSPALNNTLLGLVPAHQRGNVPTSGMNQLGLTDSKRPVLPSPSGSMTSLRGERESAFNTFLVNPMSGSLFNGNQGASSSSHTQSGPDRKKTSSAYAKRSLPSASRAKGSAQLSQAFGANIRNSEIRAPPMTAVPPALLELRTNKAGQVIVPLVLDPTGNAIRPSPSELQQAMANSGAGQGLSGPVQRNEWNQSASTHNQPLFPQPSSTFSQATTGGSGSGGHHLTDAQKAERAARKAARKEAKRIARENGEAESSDDGRDAEGFKKYRCPVEGCKKSYKQANGLKYHLNRSINNSHGHLAGMPIAPHNPNT